MRIAPERVELDTPDIYSPYHENYDFTITMLRQKIGHFLDSRGLNPDTLAFEDAGEELLRLTCAYQYKKGMRTLAIVKSFDLLVAESRIASSREMNSAENPYTLHDDEIDTLCRQLRGLIIEKIPLLKTKEEPSHDLVKTIMQKVVVWLRDAWNS